MDLPTHKLACRLAAALAATPDGAAALARGPELLAGCERAVRELADSARPRGAQRQAGLLQVGAEAGGRPLSLVPFPRPRR